MKNRNKMTKFPVARIKRIMQKDDDVGKVAQATPVVISKALEMFLSVIVDESAKVTQDRGAKKVEAYHLKHAVETTEMLDFLKEIVEAVPDPSQGGTVAVDARNHPRQRPASRSGAGGDGGAGGGSDDEEADENEEREREKEKPKRKRAPRRKKEKEENGAGGAGREGGEKKKRTRRKKADAPVAGEQDVGQQQGWRRAPPAPQPIVQDTSMEDEQDEYDDAGHGHGRGHGHGHGHAPDAYGRGRTDEEDDEGSEDME